MSKLDLVIFGATGFTGKHAVIQLVRFAHKYNVTWAVAGRSQKKLEQLMAEVSQKTGEDVSKIKLIVADVKDEESLNAMCGQCKVLVNCCGPYRLYGEPVVRAAIQNNTHYVDVSGEPEFMETMQLVYGAQAREAGVYIISACGWDSIPCDMGVTYLMDNFTGTLNSVESYLSSYLPPQYSSEARSRGIVNYGTWESLVLSLANQRELGPLRKKLYPDSLPPLKPKLERKFFQKKDDEWYLPFMGADESVVYRTQRFLYEHRERRPVQFKAYFKTGGFLQTALAIFAGVFLYLMTKTTFTQNLLLNHPRLFSFGYVSREGPSKAVMDNTNFKFELVGKGWEREEDVHSSAPEKKVVVQVTGTNPGYGATVVALLMSAITVLRQTDKMPNSGGVLTPGAAFKDTDIVNNLIENGVKFEVVDAK